MTIGKNASKDDTKNNEKLSPPTLSILPVNEENNLHDGKPLAPRHVPEFIQKQEQKQKQNVFWP